MSTIKAGYLILKKQYPEPIDQERLEIYGSYWTTNLKSEHMPNIECSKNR